MVAATGADATNDKPGISTGRFSLEVNMPVKDKELFLSTVRHLSHISGDCLIWSKKFDKPTKSNPELQFERKNLRVRKELMLIAGTFPTGKNSYVIKTICGTHGCVNVKHLTAIKMSDYALSRRDELRQKIIDGMNRHYRKKALMLP